MVDSCNKIDLRGLEWVFNREVDVESEHTTRIQ
jgi:hypothetical protein